MGASDPCLYVDQKENLDDFFALRMYVADPITINNNLDLRRELVTEMSRDFKLVDIGEAKWILGMSLLHR